MLDYKLIEALAMVVREGGFEKAAHALHLTQSAVSQRIKLLEEQTGCLLLVRTSPPAPTVAGKEILKHYRQVCQLETDLATGLGWQQEGFTTVPIGINADSLATWFFPAIESYLKEKQLLLDLAVDDQAQTHQLLRDGEVLGCISDRSDPFQGCRVESLGIQVYRMYCTPEYKTKWFDKGIDIASVQHAPILIFNRKDLMHGVLLAEALGHPPAHYNAFYLPSSEKFAPTIASGQVCGMLPHEQADEYVNQGALIEMLPGYAFTVHLHWHCWNLESRELRSFTAALVEGAQRELTPAQ
ncbi:LysR family transcriptional regulator ArgP [Pseudodesulfovibrio piezophilus]|uniref:Transcriptional regulator, LysR family n=1 Tax=Pseudodesulfovibrio piezophilus (strain DSM 21447 / JCM 15486 / C1TLV30) TaxID=1322246 RepID=M1WTF3_PSEP2|nr:LysR family transcriptional regulator ArgP [Pseudodesulfovibrio piezophilus]CCH49522.1 Transcriptional regulator, LysR family [Pseudodesulfovibrio piezophilus C1TLV30]